VGNGATIGSFCCLEEVSIAAGEKICPHTVLSSNT
jgi:hypothetical protein